ncbi:ankyrin-3-like [Lineus longissimus]|uniref:ankyrin-3-like n=1 Tax=Lineus longissimus TaxID=88925 RepID=UPI00315CA115
MATGGQGHSYPRVKESPENSWPYYMKGDEKFPMTCEMGSFLYTCRKHQTNLTLYQLCKQINSGADVNSNEGGWSPLDVAYYNKNYLILRVLLANCAMVCNIASPLHIAIAGGCFREAERYLSKVHGLDVSKLPSLVGESNYTEGNPYVDLTKGALGDDVEGEEEEFVVDESCLDERLKKDTAVEVQKIVHYKFRYTPEMKAKAGANVELMLYDMKTFDINLKDCNSDTPLHLASIVGNTGLAELLIKCGANIDLCNLKGYPPLLYACSSCNPDVVNLLIKLGAKVEQYYRGDDGILRGPFLHAVVGMGKGSYKGVEKLLEKGINVQTPDQGGCTALHLAARFGDVDCVGILIEHGANVNAVEPVTGRTPLYFACNAHHYDVVRYLVEHGSNMEAKDRLSEPPIIAVLENMDYLKNINPFYLYFASIVYTVPRLTHTLKELINHGCRLVFLFNVDLMLRVYKRTKDIFRYLMSSGSQVRGISVKVHRKIVMEIVNETDSDSIMMLRSCGYDLSNDASIMGGDLICALYEPLPLMSLCRLTIRGLIHTNTVTIEPQSRLKSFFKKLSLKPDIPKAIPLSAFEPLPLPKALKLYLCFQDFIDVAIENDVSYVDCSAIRLHDKVTSLKGDTGKLEKMLLDEAMQELGLESRHMFKSYYEAQKKLLKAMYR